MPSVAEHHTSPGSNLSKNRSGPARRIPRGATSKTDPPVWRMMQQAVAYKKRIRGMERVVTNSQSREDLRSARRRLVEVILLIKSRPEAVTMGTYAVIEDTVTEAKRIFVKAPKAEKRRPENARKKANGKLRKAEMDKSTRYTGEEDPVVLLVGAISERKSRDEVADTFQIELEQSQYN